MRRRTLVLIVTAVLLVLGGAVGMAYYTRPGPVPCPTEPVPGVGIAVGAHANAPEPVLPQPVMDEVLKKVSANGGKAPGVTLITVEGRPAVACVVALDSSGGNDDSRTADRDTFVTALRGRVSETRARQPEANYLRALGMASAAAGPGGLVVLDGPGLQTTSPLNFTEGQLLDADIASTVEKLAQSGNLPDLHGRRVLLVSLGYTVDPQADIRQNGQSHLMELWQRIAERAGAESVQVIDVPNTNPSATGLPRVSPVPLPPEYSPRCNTETIFTDDSPVGFRPNSTKFLDKSRATDRLSGIGRWLADHAGAHAKVTGSIAHYGSNNPHGLSEGRAMHVREILLQQGAADSQITAVGAGWGPFPDASAGPDARSDPRNRRVTIELTC